MSGQCLFEFHGRVLKKSIGSFSSTTAATGLGYTGQGVGIKILGYAKKSFFKPLVAKVHLAELFFGPAQRSWWLPAEQRAKILLYRQTVDIPGQGGIAGILASAATGFADTLPPRSPVTGSAVLPGIDKCFQKYWPNTVHYFPIPDNLTTGSGQDMGSQVENMYLGQNEESTVIDCHGKVFSAGPVGPANPSVSGLETPGCAGKGYGADYSFSLATDQVTYSGSAQIAALQRMPGIDHALPQLPLISVAIDHDQLNFAKFRQAAMKLGASRIGLDLSPAGRIVTGDFTPFWQSDQAKIFKSSQGDQTSGSPGLAIVVLPGQVFAELSGQLGSADIWLGNKGSVKPLERCVVYLFQVT
jgi:hypothetical protein